MDPIQRLKQLEDKVKECTAERIRKEEQLKILRQQRDEILSKLKAEGIDPEQLDNLLTQLRADLDAQLHEIEKQLS